MLFLISNGDYTHSFEDRVPVQHVVIIEGQSKDDPHVVEAIEKLARIQDLDLDEVVVNPLGEPV